MDFKAIFAFLKQLSLNNNREWFNEHKAEFLPIKDGFELFINKLIPKIREIDPLIGPITSKDCIFRIYRDIRFSPNKDPYKIHLGAYISNGGRKSQMAGYYIHIQPGQSFLAAGAYIPPADILKEIRYEVFDNIDEFKNIIGNKDFENVFSTPGGDKVKTVPKGFPKDFPDIELIKLKSYEIIHYLYDDLFLSGNIEAYLINVIKIALPFNRFLNKAIAEIINEKRELPI